MTALLAWLWQGLLLAAAIGLLLRAMPRLNAATRHAIWWAALGGLVVLAAIHAGAGDPAAHGAAFEAGGPAVLPVEPVLTLPRAPGWLPAAVLGAWLAFALLRLGRVGRSMRHVARLRSAAVPLDESRVSRLSLWSRTRRQGRAAELRVTDRPIGACALGFRRPVILVSRHLLDALDDDALDQVVMHEQAHLDRGDDWLRLVQSILAACGCIHPAVHLVGRRIDLEREAACDDRVVSVTGEASRYATCLTDVAVVTASRAPTAVLAVMGGPSPVAHSLRARIVRLLDPRADRGRRLARPATLTVAILVTAAAAAAPHLAPLVAFARAHTPSLASRPMPIGFSGTHVAEPAVLVPGEAARMADDRAGARAGVGREGWTLRAVPLEPLVAEAPAAPSGWAETTPSPVAFPPADDRVTAVPPGVPLAPPVGTSRVAALELPPSELVDDPAPAAPARPGAEVSVFGGVSQVGRTSAATARRMGLSVAGAATRLGKAVGSIF